MKKAALTCAMIALFLLTAGCRLTGTDIKTGIYNAIMPDMLEIPQDAKDVSFVQGTWFAVEYNKSTHLNQDFDKYYQFNQFGTGTVHLKELKTGDVCQGSAQASLRGNVLEIKTRNMVCTSGRKYNDTVSTCQKEDMVGTICRGINMPTHIEFSFTLQRQ